MDFIKSEDLARWFGVTSTTVNKWAEKNKWQRVSFGGPYYVNLNDVRAYVEEHSF
jgi:uncharacterized protein YjcR